MCVLKIVYSDLLIKSKYVYKYDFILYSMSYIFLSLTQYNNIMLLKK